VSKLLRNKDFRMRLISAPTPQAVFDLIQSEEGISIPPFPANPVQGESEKKGVP